jgi:hypothetical protein
MYMHTHRFAGRNNVPVRINDKKMSRTCRTASCAAGEVAFYHQLELDSLTGQFNNVLFVDRDISQLSSAIRLKLIF